MGVRKRILICMMSLIAFSFGSCGMWNEEENLLSSQEGISTSPEVSDDEENAETQNRTSEDCIDISKAIEISLGTDSAKATDLLHLDASIEKNGEVTETGTYAEISECARNEDDIFYTEGYGEDGAQYYYLNRIYRYDREQKKGILLYETSSAVWLNEFLANDSYLYWVEYVYAEAMGDFDYNVMQYNLVTEEITCIASRNATTSEEICLAASNEYVTWYDSYKSGETKIVIFDVAEQKLQTMENTDIQKYMPYERLNIVDDGITFFSLDAEDRIFINRYHLNTQETDVLLLGAKSDFNKLASCFSSSEYIGWLTEYSYGTFYFYNMKTGELYSLNQSDDMRVFSKWLSKYLYINESSNGRVYVYDFETKETYYQNIEQGSGLSLRPYGEELLYMKTTCDENVELLTIHLLKE